MKQERNYTVQFVGDHFCMSVTVHGTRGFSREKTIQLAADLIEEHYGWKVMDVSYPDDMEIVEW